MRRAASRPGFEARAQFHSVEHGDLGTCYAENLAIPQTREGAGQGFDGNAQVAGTDFSFILNFGAVNFPEYPEAALDASRSAQYLKRINLR